jgi:hypothetical protein
MNANAVAKVAQAALKQSIAILTGKKTLAEATRAVVKLAEKAL